MRARLVHAVGPLFVNNSSGATRRGSAVMEPLTGGAERVSLGGNVSLIAPGLRGEAKLLAGAVGEVRAAEESSDLFDEALARADMRGLRTVEIRVAQVPTPPAAQLRDARGDDALMLEVPDLGEDAEQVVLSVDEAGAMTWHFATDVHTVDDVDEVPVRVPAGGAGTMRGAQTRRFVINRSVPATDANDAGTHRALFGALGRKLLKVLVFPVSDALLNKPARVLAERWEANNRTYGLRRFTPDNYRLPTATPAERDALSLTRDDASALTAGRALLFVHGTFSTAHGAFHDIPPELMQELHQRYGGRVFAFNHFSLSHDPLENVRQFNTMLQQLLPSGSLDVDIVAHSRGGLVARTLADGGDVFGLDTSRINVHRAVFAGVPNQGTPLAKPDHMIEMIDRLTTGLNVVPAGGVADLLEGLLIAVKIIGHGALKALAGLRSMDPDGDFLRTLNRPGRRHDGFLAIAANYEPVDTGLKSLVGRAANSVVDRVFEKEGNDLVVPERGVYDVNGCDSFPIADDRCLRLPTSAGIMHTGMFGHPEVSARLRDWLL